MDHPGSWRETQHLTKYGEVEDQRERRETVTSAHQAAPAARDRAGLEAWSADAPGVTSWRGLGVSEKPCVWLG